MLRKRSKAAPAAVVPEAPVVPPDSEVRSGRGRKFVRLFLMAAGGLAAPCLALAAFFLSNSGADSPAAKSSVVQGGRVTTTTARKAAPAPPPTVTTTTTTTAPLPARPPRDPFAPLVTQTPAGSPAR